MTELRIVRGTPTEEELAALLVALASVQRTTASTPAKTQWSSYGRHLRAPMQAGRDAWRRSAWARNA